MLVLEVRTRGDTMGKMKQAGRPNKPDLDQCSLAGKRADTVEAAWIPASKPRFAAADYIKNGGITLISEASIIKKIGIDTYCN